MLIQIKGNIFSYKLFLILQSNLESPLLVLLLLFFVLFCFVFFFFRESKGETECDFTNKIIDCEQALCQKIGNRESRMSRANEPQKRRGLKI